jgi:hypothetical protein
VRPIENKGMGEILQTIQESHKLGVDNKLGDMIPKSFYILCGLLRIFFELNIFSFSFEAWDFEVTPDIPLE